MEWRTHFRTGFTLIRRYPWLTVGLYALGLGFSVVVLMPLAVAVERATADTALPLDLREVTLGSWWAVLRESSESLGRTLLLGFLLVPLHGLVRALLLVGTAAALQPGRPCGFWEGVGRYGARGLGLALLLLAASLLWLVAVVSFSSLLALAFSGERALFWTQLVLVPVLLIAGLAFIDLAHDYARAALVVGDEAVGRAVRIGWRFPFHSQHARRLYLAWFGLAVGLWLLPFVLDAGLRIATPRAIMGLFALQQVALLARAGVTTGWVGSSVRLYADITDREQLAADKPGEPSEPRASVA